MKTLNILGAGRLGQTLAHLWHNTQVLTIQALANRTLESAQRAQAFISTGQLFTLDQIEAMPQADLWLIACPDDQLKIYCERLAATQNLTHSLVFHCSGALTAQEVLASAKAQGASIASIHPIKSFAQPQLAVSTFAGTYCGMEGDAQALEVLVPLFTKLSAHTFIIKAEAKTLYHAASVIACNYLVALQELALQTYAQAGVERTQALAILQPIVTTTVQTMFQLDTSKALTGPIARGDTQTVAKQLTALNAWNPDYAGLYQSLGQIALQLTRKQHNLEASSLAVLEQLLTARP
ncbi:MAG: Rossmann-like and DUF2520 domain-containing protein [Thiofilum sp.]|uniref:Rossmann-like and DUF2520 domain-containing protein n=1 Tax=Thiofilum sp. TaxID=2212733 RepID=UPI0025F8CA1C|nr:Rossmann-like and DUF2520 domain-containing protein [Thiofilum sp.]MBK8451823.1 DUF2520 domain-containing protein [Thiofilum sp.]